MPDHTEGASDVTVLGAGIIGVCSALHLQEKGLNVTLIDRLEPGEATSYGNAGVISPWSCVPQSMPGLWKSVPKWMLDPQGPVRARLSILPRLLPWSLEFFRNAQMDRLQAIADTMAVLVSDNAIAYKALLQGTGQEDLVRDSWNVSVFRGQGTPNLDDLAWKLRIDRGAPVEVVDRGALKEIEPDLSDEYHSAVVFKDQARAHNPSKICKALAEKAVNNGARFVKGDVQDVRPTGSGGFDLIVDGRLMPVNKLVLCGGIWSDKLLRNLGIKLPLMAERGYHLEFQDPGVSLNNSLLDVSQKFIVSSMEGGIRSAGTAEFAHVDAPPDYRRADMLEPLTKRMLPGLNTSKPKRWMGARPSFPDNLPVIDRMPGFENLFGAFGHSHYGLGMAPGTGRLLAQIVTDTRPNAGLEGVRVARFLR